MSLTVISPTQLPARIDDQQLFDAVLVQQPLGLVLVDVLLHRDQVVAGHQLVDLLRRIGGEAHVAVGQDADQPAGLLAAVPPFSTTGMPGNAVRAHQRAARRRASRRGRW